jgi:hypothetical protein
MSNSGTTYTTQTALYFPNTTVTYYSRSETYSKTMRKAIKKHESDNEKVIVAHFLSFYE